LTTPITPPFALRVTPQFAPPPGPLSRPRDWRTLALVLGAHALLLSLLATSTLSPWRRPSGPAPRLSVVWLEALRPRPGPEPDAAPAPRAPQRGQAPAPRAPQALAPAAAAAPAFSAPVRPPITEPVTALPGGGAPVAPEAPGATVSTAAAPGSAASAHATAPLRLELPRLRRAEAVPSPAQQAVERQAGGQPRLNAEARLVRRLETHWTEENLGDGRIRLRRGEDCVILKETTASQLDPWNNRGPAPRGASPCP
jgi:hypothetical protein